MIQLLLAAPLVFSSTACLSVQEIDDAELSVLPGEPGRPGPLGDEIVDAPMVYVLEWLRAEHDLLGENLERLHGALLARAEAEDPTLAARLTPDATKPLPRGYGVVPALKQDGPLRTLVLTRTVYSLEEISWAYPGAFRDAAVLAERAERDPSLPLAWGVDEYERVGKRMRSLDEHLSYHEFWQRRVHLDREFFEERNAIVALVRELKELRDTADDGPRRAELEREVRERVAPFRATRGLSIEVGEAGDRLLVVPIATDLEDDAFLSAFSKAVKEVWSGAEAARTANLRFEVEFRRLSPETLYPEGRPADRSPVSVDDHLARFPADLPVLTTGADSLHSMVGRTIQLGPKPVTPRVLAHEFGHLLGFADAYLRGYEGDPQGIFGVRLVEWTGILDDLMGGPAVGFVSESMIAEVLEAYGR